MRRDNRRNTFPARAGARGSGTKLAQLELHGASSGTKLAPHEPHGATSDTKLTQLEVHGASSGTKLALQAQNLPIWRVLCAQGEFCPATTSNKTVTPPLPGTKLAPHEPHGATSDTKLALHAQNLLIWRVLLLLGEFYPVFVANKPSMASFLPHKHQHYHRHERNNTPTQHTKPRDERLSAHAPQKAPHNETFIAPARHKQPKFTHFHHVGANFLSQHTPHTRTRATFLSTNSSASKIDPNKTFIIFDSLTRYRPDRKDIADGGPVTT